MKIPEEKIQEIREATDIVELVSQHVTLKKRGKTYLGLCPFHNEKTPSFNVDPVRHFYHCFGCGAGGNVFTFLMAMEKIGFPEAVRQLAQKAGIAMPEHAEDDFAIKETEQLYHVNQFAAAFFVRCLKETEAGGKAKRYFTERGFTDEMLETFGIGYAPKTWEGLVQAAKKEGISTAALMKAGVVVESQRGTGAYDRFRGRLMFPITNASGRVVGFGGRLLVDEPRQPKYLNSPETPIYQKSRLVYGLAQAKTAIREQGQVLLVEGYTDVVRLHQAGLPHVVATSGTALTHDQARLMKRYAKRVALVYDGDSAGLEAAQRGAEVLLAGGLDVSIVPLPPGSDPDTFVRASGAEGLAALIETGKSFIDFRLSRLTEAGRLKTVADRAEAARGLLETIRKIPEPIERDLSMKSVAEKLDVDLRVLARAAGKPSGSDLQHDRPDGRPRAPENARQVSEKMLIRLLLENSGLWGDAIFNLVEPQHFEAGPHRTVVETIHAGYLQGEVPGLQQMLDQFQERPAVGKYLTDVMAEGLAEEIDLSRLGLECAVHLRKLELQTEIEASRLALKTASGEEMLVLHKQYVEQKQRSLGLRQVLESEWKKLVEI